MSDRVLCPKCRGMKTVGGGRLDWDFCDDCDDEGKVPAPQEKPAADGDWPWLRDVAGD